MVLLFQNKMLHEALKMFQQRRSNIFCLFNVSDNSVKSDGRQTAQESVIFNKTKSLFLKKHDSFLANF